MLPFSLGSAVISAVSGIILTRVGHYRPILFFAWSVMTLGYGLMILLSSTSSMYVFFTFLYRP